MINRGNYQLVTRFLAERENLVCPASVKMTELHLKKLLEYIGPIPLEQISTNCLGYKAALLASGLGLEYVRKNLSETRNFLQWLKDEYGIPVTTTWIKRNFAISAKEKNMANLSSTKATHYFSLEDVLTIVKTPVNTLVEERTRAASALLFLSGARVSAFLSLPIKAVNIKARTIKQWTALNVRTKLSKSATTRLVEIPNYPILIETIAAWDEKVRAKLPDSAMWFPNIDPKTNDFDKNLAVGQNRCSGFRKDLILFLEKAGVEFRSPHKFRHGIIRYVRNFAKTARDLEAIAINFMQTPQTMLSYGRLSSDEANIIMDELCRSSALEKSESPAPQSPLDTNVEKAFYEFLKKKYEETR